MSGVRRTAATGAKSRYRNQDGDDAAHEPSLARWCPRELPVIRVKPLSRSAARHGPAAFGALQTPLRTRQRVA